MSARKSNWYVYMVRCSDGTLYTGITTDIQRRVTEHNSKKASAKYTKARQPVVLVYSEQAASRSSASVREYQLKQFPRKEKLEFILANGI